MEIDIIVNDILFELKRVYPKSMDICDYLEKNSRLTQLEREIRKKLIEADIVDFSNTSSRVRINSKGINIYNNGGWKKYINEIEEKEKC